MKNINSLIGLCLLSLSVLIFVAGCEEINDSDDGGWVCPTDSQGYVPCDLIPKPNI